MNIPNIPSALPSIPLDDFTLNAIEHALGTCYGDVDPATGGHELVGGEFTLSQYLDFLGGTVGRDPNEELIQAGRDESDLPEWERGRDWSSAEIVYDTRPHYTRDGLIAALVAEVRRTREQTQLADLRALFVPGADFEPCPVSCTHSECEVALAVLAVIGTESTRGDNRE